MSTNVSRAALPPLLALLQLGCAFLRPPSHEAGSKPIQVFSRSHNHSAVDVYVLCGDRDATWLGTIGEKAEAGFAIPSERAFCVRGLHFFLVVQKSGWGYWVGPVRPRVGAPIDLVIEKYAGLSTARALW
jgi:hypothetical protein